jgi:hypothetical protein
MVEMQQCVSTAPHTTLLKLMARQCPTYEEFRDLLFMNLVSDEVLQEMVWHINPDSLDTVPMHYRSEQIHPSEAV